MKKILYIILLSLIGSSAFGQHESVWKLNYVMGLPTGDFNSFINKMSFRGFSFSGARYLNYNLSVGGSFTWSGFYERESRETYEFENGAITGERQKELYPMTFQVFANYDLITDATINPFVGLGLGAYFIEKDDQVGRFVGVNEAWKFGFMPQAGVLVPFGTLADVGLVAKVGYNFVFYDIDNIKNLGYFNFTVGFFFW